MGRIVVVLVIGDAVVKLCFVVAPFVSLIILLESGRDGAIVMGRIVVMLVVGGAVVKLCFVVVPFVSLIILLESGRDGAIVMGRIVVVLVVGSSVVVSFGFKAGIITKITNRVITKIAITIIIVFFGVSNSFSSL
jgi:hypothetical protein